MTDAYRQVGVHAAAKKPADLPLALPTKYELVTNLRTEGAGGGGCSSAPAR